jgi:hypothetical protein
MRHLVFQRWVAFDIGSFYFKYFDIGQHSTLGSFLQSVVLCIVVLCSVILQSVFQRSVVLHSVFLHIALQRSKGESYEHHYSNYLLSFS